jgi:hypothetical protein
MALGKVVILRRPRSGRLEGRTVLLQPISNSFTRSQAGAQGLRTRRAASDGRCSSAAVSGKFTARVQPNVSNLLGILFLFAERRRRDFLQSFHDSWLASG